jgi:hypothetical protein
LASRRYSGSGIRIPASDWIGSKKRSELFCGKLLAESRQVAEWDRGRIRKHGAEFLAPEIIAHQGEGAAGKTVKRARRIQQSRPSGGGAGEFDRALNALASRAGEKDFAHFAARQSAKPLRQLTRQIRHMALQHRRAAAAKLIAKLLDDVGMIVARVVNAVSGEEVEDHIAFGSEELDAGTAHIARVHLKEIEQAHPLWVDVVCIVLRSGERWKRWSQPLSFLTGLSECPLESGHSRLKARSTENRCGQNQLDAVGAPRVSFALNIPNRLHSTHAPVPGPRLPHDVDA